jgi:hypothetical protein
LAGTGLTLAWSIVFSGVLPELKSVQETFASLEFLWSISGPRWAVEAYWISDVGARAFIEDKPPNPTPYNYNFGNFG